MKNNQSKHTNDLLFIKMCIRNKDDTWEKVYRIYKSMFEEIAKKYYCSNDCDILVSNFMFKLLGKKEHRFDILKKYSGAVALSTYLSSVFRNVVKEYLRKEAKFHSIHKLTDDINSFSTEMMQSSPVENLMQDLITCLSKEDSTLLYYRYQHGLTFYQLGFFYKCSRKVAARKVKRAQKHLKKLFKDDLKILTDIKIRDTIINKKNHKK